MENEHQLGAIEGLAPALSEDFLKQSMSPFLMRSLIADHMRTVRKGRRLTMAEFQAIKNAKAKELWQKYPMNGGKITGFTGIAELRASINPAPRQP